MPIPYTLSICFSTNCFICLDFGSNSYNYTRLVTLEYFLTVPSVRNYGVAPILGEFCQPVQHRKSETITALVNLCCIYCDGRRFQSVYVLFLQLVCFNVES